MVNRNSNFDLNDYKITMNGQEIDVIAKDLEHNIKHWDTKFTPLKDLKFECDIEYTLPKIIPYTVGKSKKGEFKTFTSGNLEGKDYNFIVLFKGDDNKEDYDYILDNLLSHICCQLWDIIYERKTKINTIFGTSNTDSIEFGIEQLFRDKWRKMFNSNVFYKKFKFMRITFGEIKTSIILSINEFQRGNY